MIETPKPASILEILPFLAPCILIGIGLYVELKYRNIVFILWLIYAVAPLLDYVLPHDNYNLAGARVRIYERDKRFLIPLYVTFFLDWALLFYMLSLVHSGYIAGSFWNYALYAWAVAHAGGVNATVGHELLHRKETVHKVCGTAAYFKMLYSHFFIEHVRGHHKLVATPEDPTTARRDESLYHFFTRVPAGYPQVWNYEKNRLEKEGKSAFALSNRLISFNLGHAAYLTLIALIFDLKTMCFHIMYSFFCVILLETINYIEHYGLLRKKDQNGIYESINIKHSWNAPHTFTNALLFKL